MEPQCVTIQTKVLEEYFNVFIKLHSMIILALEVEKKNLCDTSKSYDTYLLLS